MVIPSSGNILSGGLGGSSPTFQFSFDDGFAPPQGGNIRLYATWQGVVTSGNSITLPTRFATDEMPPGINGFTVAEQIFVCGGGGLCHWRRHADRSGQFFATCSGLTP